MGKDKKPEECEEIAGWLITFSDMMTLMLTFFVLLVSMANIDERRKLVVLGSVYGSFGFGDASYDVLAIKDTKKTVEPGPMQDAGDLEPLKPMLWEDVGKDLDFQSNKFVQIFKINADVLFAPGEVTLTPRGKELLNKVYPVLRNVEYPVLLAGHASFLRDELGQDFLSSMTENIPDASWKISLDRTLSVYLHLVDLGMPTDKMKMEAFGRFRPQYSMNTPEGRQRNRTVNIILDKRAGEEQMIEVEEVAKSIKPKEKAIYDVDGFKFDIDEVPQRQKRQ
ncbi:MAG: OmpA/MotB family protein [Desulfovibrio sp.]